MAITSLFQDLQATDPTIRFSVLSRIERQAWNEADLGAFRDLLAAETDPGMRFHMELILRFQERGRGDRTTRRTLAADVAAILEAPSPDYLSLACAFRDLEAAEALLALDILRERHWERFPDEALPFVLRLLKEHGGPEDVPNLEALCRHGNPRVLAAAVEALERISPENLKGLVVPLLLNASPGIQSMAIRILYRWDPREAARHLHALLGSPDRKSRESALFFAWFFPFEEIGPPLLRFISLEEDPDLVVAACRLCIVNPDLEVVSRLSEILEDSLGDKREQIRRTIIDTVAALGQAGLVEESPQTILERLTARIQERRAGKFLERCRETLAGAEESRREAVILKLLQLRAEGLEGAGEVLQEQASREESPRLREFIAAGLGGGESPAPASEAIFTSLRRWVVARQTRPDAPLPGVFRAAPLPVQVQILQRAAQAPGEEGVTLLATMLHHPEAGWAPSAIDLLVHRSPATLVPLLPDLLRSNDPDTQMGALRALALTHKREAVRVLEQFLFSSRVERRRAGIWSLFSFDPPAVLPLARGAFVTETDPDNRRQLIEFLATVLDPSGLVALYQLCGDRLPDPAGREEWLRPLAEKLLASGRFPGITLEQLWQQAREADLQARAATGKEAPAYSLETVERLRTGPEDSLPQKRASPLPATGGIVPAESGPPPTGPSRHPAQGAEPRGTAGSLADELQDLSSNALTARFLALLRLNTRGWPPDRWVALQGMHDRESDPGTRFHLEKILAERAPVAPKTADPAPATGFAMVQGLLETATPSMLDLANALERCSLREGPGVMELLRKAAWWTFPAEVLPFVLAFIRRAGSVADGPRVQPLCEHQDPRVVLTAVEALQALNPEDLRSQLVPLLLHDDPGVRGAAVRLLYKWDPEEGLAHFAAALSSQDVQERNAAMYSAYFLDFPRIEPLLLRFLSMENDLVLIEKAGYLFKMNPLIEEPGRLLEVWEGTSGEKRERIGAIVRGVAEALSQAGIRSESPEAIIAKLREEYRERKVRNLLEQCRAGLGAASAEQRRIACQRLQTLEAAGVAEAANLLDDHQARESDPETRAWLGTLSRPAHDAHRKGQTDQAAGMPPEQEGPPSRSERGPEKEGVPETLPPGLAPAGGDPEQLSAAERTRWLDGLTADRFRPQAALLTKWLATLPPPERIPVLEAIGRCGSPADALPIKRLFIRDGARSDGQEATRNTAQGATEDVLVAAIRAIRQLDIALLDPLFPGLLKHPAPAVREAALGAFLLRDKRQALTYLEQILFSQKVADRTLGAFALGQIDFLTAADLVFAALEKETEAGILAQLLTILEAHPAPEIFLRLLKLSGAEADSKRQLLQRGVEGVAQALLAKGVPMAKDPGELLAWAEEQLQSRAEKERAPPPAYALKKIQQARQEKARPEPSPTDRLGPMLEAIWLWGAGTGRWTRAVLGLGFLACVWWMTASLGGPAAPTPGSFQGKGFSVGQPGTPSQTLTVGKVLDLEGTVETIGPDGALVALKGSPARILVRFTDPPAAALRPGQPFVGKVQVEKMSRTRFLGRLIPPPRKQSGRP